MIKSLNSAISDEIREQMIERFTEMCSYYERIAMDALGTDTLTNLELLDCVKDADTDVAVEFGFRMRDIFV
jgi:hypothetical protein